MADFKIWMNGRLVPGDQAVLPVNSAAVFYATNVFEGLRAYWNADDGELYGFRLQEHFARLRESMVTTRCVPAEVAAAVMSRMNGCPSTVRSDEVVVKTSEPSRWAIVVVTVPVIAWPPKRPVQPLKFDVMVLPFAVATAQPAGV